MNKRGGLGKGLGAIFGENTSAVAQPEAVVKEQPTLQVPVKNISPNPYQPRRDFDDGKLQELVSSVKEFGIVQPLVVRKEGKKYQLVAGERRLRAAKIVGLSQVPVVIGDYDDAKMMEIALVENIQRHNLNPIEEALGLKQLMSHLQLTQEQVAEKVGRSRVAVTNILRMLNLPQPVQEMLMSGAMTMGQAKQLLGLPSEEQLMVAQSIIEYGWSSRMTEEIVRLLKEGKEFTIAREIVAAVEKKDSGKRPAKPPKDVFCLDFEQRLVELLGTKVRVQPKAVDGEGRQGGTISIEYYSAEDLERIYQVLQPEKESGGPKAFGRLQV